MGAPAGDYDAVSAMVETIQSVDQLDDLLSEPPDSLVHAFSRLPGDIVVLGVAGKMGPTLARMARRASDLAQTRRRVIGVARFSDSSLEPWLQRHGVETLQCDLLDARAVARLPEAPLVVYMAGRKFGSTGQESLTWAMNAAVPVYVSERYADSRIAMFSTGNVYGLTPMSGGGSRETDRPSPVGEYAMSCLARERIFEHFSHARRTRTAILRLNYATEMRYGLLVDLARQVASGHPVDVTMGYFNVIWQGDANAMALHSLAHATSPALVVNLAGQELLSVRETCQAIAARLGVDVSFTGLEAPDALLSDGSTGWSLLGRPRVSAERLIAWTADWVGRGGASLDKPTHFESRDGRF
jgi:nucleoside-diphosphate-sugar epimerase